MSDKVKDYLIFFFITFSVSIFLIFIYDKYIFSKKSNVIYVVNIKDVVDAIRRDYLLKSSKDLSNSSKYEQEMKNRFYKVDKYLKSKRIIIFEKSALVYYPLDGKVIDLTPEILSILGLGKVK